MCYSRMRVTEPRRRDDRPATDTGDAGRSATDVRRPSSERVGDRERDEVMVVLSDSFAEGRLTREEFDERSAKALAARTGADLAVLTADLPAAGQDRARAVAPHQRRPAQRVRAEVRSYAAVMFLLLIIWLVAGLTAQAWYPWFVWPALGWGIGIVARARRTLHATATRA
jgi:hypothetical protein